ncbi:MAG TPA: transglycosylase domain-containing protein [Anaeromyxobacteraceae bacterium]|nr:transglycosylase domain-containing protein [Anaeromyxobacteraceae bacterium]
MARRTTRRVLLAGLAGVLGLLLLGPPIAAELLYRYELRQVGPPPAPVTTALPPTALAASWVDASESLPMKSVAIWKWHCPLTLLETERLGRTVPGERMASRAARVWLGQQASPLRGLRWQLAWGAATVWISRHLTAEEMTRVWISGAWFGRGARGLDAAADAYFGKKADTLRLHELALLVGLTQAPSRFDPDCRPEDARARRKYVLDRLLEVRVISAGEHDDAVAEPLGTVPRACRRE